MVTQFDKVKDLINKANQYSENNTIEAKIGYQRINYPDE